MIERNFISPQTVEVFNFNGLSIGSLNEYEFNDLRCQIAEDAAQGYYVLFNDRKIMIQPDGKLEHWPEGLFDLMEQQMARIFKARRDSI